MSSEPSVPSRIPTPKPPKPPRFAGKRILLVEDLPALSRRVEEQLREEGATVYAVPDYHAAARTLGTVVPDVALINLTLPRESGFELCELIRSTQSLASVPIIAMDERASPEDLAYAEEVGANAFLRKPFTRAQLFEYLAAMLDGPWVSRPNGVLFLCRALRP
jgi:twitching motility two-component system response regulator PilH